MRVTTIVVAALTITISVADAQQQLTSDQQQILRTTMNAEGWLTADDHKRFWAPILPQLNNPEVLAEVRQTMDHVVGLGMRFQLETWRSIQLSEREGRVVKTPDYEDAKRAVMSDSVMGAQSASGIQNAEGMLQAAASKSAFNTAQQGQIYLSADMIERTLSGIEGSSCRIRRLFDPEWKDQATEYKYPAAHVAILNDCPLTVEQTQITTEQGITAKMVTLSYGLSAHDRIGVTFTPSRCWRARVALAQVARCEHSNGRVTCERGFGLPSD